MAPAYVSLSSPCRDAELASLRLRLLAETHLHFKPPPGLAEVHQLNEKERRHEFDSTKKDVLQERPAVPCTRPSALFPVTRWERAAAWQKSPRADAQEQERSAPTKIGETSAEAPAAPSTHPLQAWETTVVVQNLPGRYSQKEVLKLWPIDGTYDFLHAPYNLLHKRPLGYVFINFLTSELAAAFQKRWQGQLLPRGNNRKPLDIAAAEVQGMHANLELIKSRKIGQLAKAGFLPVVLKGARVLDSAEIAEELKELRSTKGKNPGKPQKDIALKDSRVRRLDLLRGKLRAKDEDRRSSSGEGDSDDAQTTTTGSLSQASASAGASQQW